MNIQYLCDALFPRWLWFHDISFFNPHAMLFDLGGTAKSRILLTSARTAGQYMDHSRWGYPKAIDQS